MGGVYLARGGDQEVGVKVVQIEPSDPGELPEEDARRMRREFAALLLLDHPNVVRVLAFGATDDGLPFFAMELIEGMTLGDWMEKTPAPAEGDRVIPEPQSER